MIVTFIASLLGGLVDGALMRAVPGVTRVFDVADKYLDCERYGRGCCPAGGVLLITKRMLSGGLPLFGA